MKLTTFTTFLLAMAGTALFSQSAKAQTYAQGDLLLGFVQSGNALGYDIDLGNAAQYVNGSVSGDLNLQLSSGAIATELNHAFGSNWDSNTTTAVQWGIIGTTQKTTGGPTSPVAGAGADTIFVSTTGNFFTQTSAGGADAIVGDVNSAGMVDFNTGSGNVPGATASDYEPNNNPGGSTFASYTVLGGSSGNGAGHDFATGQSILGTLNGTSTLNMFEVGPTGGVDKEIGTFSINGTTGDISFTPQSVPEPSTYVLIAMSALVIAWRLNRRALLNR